MNGLGGSGSTPPSGKPSLSKELMQKLRSMTETIKMLSDENEILKRENERIKDEEEGVYVVKQSKVLGHQNVGNVGVLPDASSNQKTSGSGEHNSTIRDECQLSHQGFVLSCLENKLTRTIASISGPAPLNGSRPETPI